VLVLPYQTTAIHTKMWRNVTDMQSPTSPAAVGGTEEEEEKADSLPYMRYTDCSLVYISFPSDVVVVEGNSTAVLNNLCIYIQHNKYR